jgi:hypothetical protein
MSLFEDSLPGSMFKRSGPVIGSKFRYTKRHSKLRFFDDESVHAWPGRFLGHPDARGIITAPPDDHLDLGQIHGRSGSVVALWPLMVDSSITRFQCNSTILWPGWLTGFRSTRWNAALNRWTECHAALPSQVLKWPLLSTEAVRSGGQRPAAAVEPTD